MAGHPGKPAQGPRDHPSVARIQIQCGARWKLTDPVIEGWVNARIAAALVIAPRTVAVHVENILAKLGAGTRALAAARAMGQGLYLPRALLGGPGVSAARVSRVQASRRGPGGVGGAAASAPGGPRIRGLSCRRIASAPGRARSQVELIGRCPAPRHCGRRRTRRPPPPRSATPRSIEVGGQERG